MRDLVQWFHSLNDRCDLVSVQRYKREITVAALAAVAILIAFQGASGQQDPFARIFTFIPNGVFFSNPNGASQTYSTNDGGIDLSGPFFQSLGTNGRTCGTCHQPSDGMSVSAANVQLRFLLTQGMDPIFRTNDGSVSPNRLSASLKNSSDDPSRSVPWL